MRKTSIFMLLALILGLTGVLSAQDKYGYEIGPYASVGIWQDRDFQVGPPQASPPIDLNFHLAERPIYGVRFNFLSRKHWGGEASYDYERNTVTLSRQGFNPVPLDGSIQHFFYNEIFYPQKYGKSPVIPFLTAGIGVAGYHLNDDTIEKAADPRGFNLGKLSDMDARFAFNYGGGVKVNVPGGFGIRADFRHNFSDVPSFGLPKESSNPAQTVLPIQGKLQMYEASVGIYFHVTK